MSSPDLTAVAKTALMLCLLEGPDQALPRMPIVDACGNQRNMTEAELDQARQELFRLKRKVENALGYPEGSWIKAP